MSEIDGGSYYPLDLQSLPPGWSVAWLGDVLSDMTPGFASGRHNRDEEGIPHLRPMNIDRQGSLHLGEIKYVSPDRGRRRLQAGDVLFNNTNSPPLVGKTAVVTVGREMAFSNHMTRLRTHPGMLPQFVAYQLHYLWMCGYFMHRCVKHVNQASISTGPLARTVPFLAAPTNEQDRIDVAIDTHFTRLDAAVESLKRAQANLKRYRASVLKAAVEGRLVPTEAELARQEGRDYEPASVLLERILKERRKRWEETELAKMEAKGKKPKDDRWRKKYKEPVVPDTNGLPELPEGWCWATLDQLSTRITDGEHITPPRTQTGVYLLSARNVMNGALSLGKVDYVSRETHAQLSRRLAVKPGDVLLSCSGSVGRSCVVPPGVAFSLVRSVAVIVPALPMGDFLSFAIRSPIVQQQIHEKKTQTAQSNIFQGKIRRLVTPLPPHAEQQRIAAMVDACLALALSEEQTIQRISDHTRPLRASILKWAFEGRLVDQDPDDEPASVLLERIRAEREKAIPKKKATRRPRRKKVTP